MTPRLRAAMLLSAIALAGAVPVQAQVLGGLTYSWANPAGDLSVLEGRGPSTGTNTYTVKW